MLNEDLPRHLPKVIRSLISDNHKYYFASVGDLALNNTSAPGVLGEYRGTNLIGTLSTIVEWLLNFVIVNPGFTFTRAAIWSEIDDQ